MTSVQLEQLDHISLNVGNRTNSIAWYRDVLGLEPHGEGVQDDWPVFMGEPGACLALFQAQTRTPERARESTGLRHVAFLVGRRELERMQERLRALAIAFTPEDHGSSYSVYFADPDGNVIELTTRER